MAAMAAASVSYEDGLFLYSVSTLAMSGTWVDRVSVVKAPADRVTFDNLIAHVLANGVTMRMVGRGIRY